MSLEQFIKKHLASGQLMQLATTSGARPWICTVYYVPDKDFNLYWLSWPARRHSRELAANQRAAAAIVVKASQPVIGLQIEGTASVVEDADTIQELMESYIAKYDSGRQYYANFMAGQAEHVLYKLTPKSIGLFDEHNFPSQARQVWQP